MFNQENILRIHINESNLTPPKSEVLSRFYKIMKKSYDGGSGLDLLVPNEMVCKPRSVTFINHQISCEMIQKTNFIVSKKSKNIPFLLVPRSSISQTPLIAVNSIGIIDSGYRGNIIGAVYNTSNKEWTIYDTTRLFQIVLPTLEEFKTELTRWRAFKIS